MRGRVTDIEFEVGFLSDPNLHKWPMFWATGAYKHLQRIVRNESIDVMREFTPNVFFFIQQLIQYIDRHGRSANDLVRFPLLARGIPLQFPLMTTEDPDKGFLAFSHDLTEAKTFAGRQGTLFELQPAQLPTTVRYVLIDADMGEHLTEDEVLLLPGTLRWKGRRIEGTYEHLSCKYIPDHAWIHALRTAPPTVPTETSWDMDDGDMEEAGTGTGMAGGRRVPRDYRGKYIVWFRAMRGRPIDIFVVQRLPKTHDGLRAYLGRTLRLMDADFESRNDFIPQFADLIKQLKNDALSLQERRTLWAAIHEYAVHRGVYDPCVGRMITLHAWAPAGIFREVFDVSRMPEVMAELNARVPKMI